MKTLESEDQEIKQFEQKLNSTTIDFAASFGQWFEGKVINTSEVSSISENKIVQLAIH